MTNITCTIHGERNSGTTFLAVLLKKNGIDVFEEWVDNLTFEMS
jgi:hypothetical protein